MRIIISNASDEPLYEQVARQIRESVLKGELKAGSALPSIRTLAKDLQISVITTKRAYEELEQEGFVETVPGKGSFVALQNKELLREKRLRIIEEKLAEIVDDSRVLNISLEELQEMLRLLWEEK
ncbi:GntR family transcriptional regulator [Dethiobacter alkaliphilus]|uniref:Transcriptional regulator, GntR family n=1 Tax=Dethiobacter alkaliphilus AHT 1 TaxID=555088 RepID=C0GC76_DETAL|nr:GntR family transcriptional regulator [Dethiobacter alkaliphilus]EEG78811.1 transcriptional regulator, GntR family [Dethiobacter alkaliphilus AHT 1]